MAVCPSCRGQVPPRAKFCPHCGAPIRRPFPLAKLLIAVALFALLAAGALIWGIWSGRVSYAENPRNNTQPPVSGEPAPWDYGRGSYSPL